MALITCPECKKEISEMAESCPGCGFPIKPKEASQPEIIGYKQANGTWTNPTESPIKPKTVEPVVNENLEQPKSHNKRDFALGCLGIIIAVIAITAIVVHFENQDQETTKPPANPQPASSSQVVIRGLGFDQSTLLTGIQENPGGFKLEFHWKKIVPNNEWKGHEMAQYSILTQAGESGGEPYECILEIIGPASDVEHVGIFCPASDTKKALKAIGTTGAVIKATKSQQSPELIAWLMKAFPEALNEMVDEANKMKAAGKTKDELLLAKSSRANNFGNWKAEIKTSGLFPYSFYLERN